MVSRSTLLVAALVLAPLLTGCSGSRDSSADKTVPPTPISELNLATLRLARAEFCDHVPAAAVRAALGGKAESDDGWGNGDPVPGSGDSGSGDVGHELGCAWSGPAGDVARAWVFARQVSAELAGALVAQAGQQPGCSAEQSTIFGTPAVLQTCTLTDGRQRVRRAGLFGDTWLTCEVGGAASTDLTRRTDQWCAAVVAALSTD